MKINLDSLELLPLPLEYIPSVKHAIDMRGEGIKASDIASEIKKLVEGGMHLLFIYFYNIVGYYKDD